MSRTCTACTEPAIVLPSGARRRARLIAAAVGGFLLPWCVFLAAVLPTSTHVGDWSVAWVGLDLAEGVFALATAALLKRHDCWAALTATAGAVLLAVDAWFDVLTSPHGRSQVSAIAEAVLVELPLAGAAIWFAVRLIGGSR